MENFFKKSPTMPKKLKGGPLDSSGMVCYAEKEEKLFWFSSLGQMIQFGSIKLCRTFKNYFGQFVWIEKKVTIIVAFHFMKRRLKIRWFVFKNLKFLPLLTTSFLNDPTILERCGRFDDSPISKTQRFSSF